MRMFSKTRLIVFLLLVVTCFSFPSLSEADNTTSETIVKLYFPKQDADDDSLVKVIRRIPKTRRVADAALRELFAGPSKIEQNDGLDSAFFPQSIIAYQEGCRCQKTRSLLSYYLGVKIKNGVAGVNFRPRATCYLQGTPSMQNRVMSPIETTLKQFKTIKEVEYVINGEIITHWDA